jgi:hypothetical protein
MLTEEQFADELERVVEEYLADRRDAAQFGGKDTDVLGLEIVAEHHIRVAFLEGAAKAMEIMVRVMREKARSEATVKP